MRSGTIGAARQQHDLLPFIGIQIIGDTAALRALELVAAAQVQAIFGEAHNGQFLGARSRGWSPTLNLIINLVSG
jgi:hypothetical protein